VAPRRMPRERCPGVIAVMDDEVDAGIAAERGKKLKEPNSAYECWPGRAERPERMRRRASSGSPVGWLIAYVRNQRGERIAPKGFVVKNARVSEV